MSVKISFPEIISYAASCMTLLSQWEIRQTKLFAAICSSVSQEDEFVKKISVFSGNRKYGLKTVSENFDKYMDNAKDNILFLQYTNAGEDCLNQINAFLAEGYYNDRSINCLVCVLFNGYIPTDLMYCFSVIIPNREIEKFLQSDWNGKQLQSLIMKRIKEIDLLKTLDKRIKQKFPQKLEVVPWEDDEKLLLETTAIIAVLQDNEDEIEKLYSVVQNKLFLSRDARDRSDIPYMFTETLYSNIKSLPPMVAYDEAVQKVDLNENYILYDDISYYIPETVMKDILKRMQKYASTIEIKQSLVQAGYLDVQGKDRNYYTQKVTVKGRRFYYNRLKRSCIDRAGYETLISACER